MGKALTILIIIVLTISMSLIGSASIFFPDKQIIIKNEVTGNTEPTRETIIHNMTSEVADDVWVYEFTTYNGANTHIDELVAE